MKKAKRTSAGRCASGVNTESRLYPAEERALGLLDYKQHRERHESVMNERIDSINQLGVRIVEERYARTITVLASNV